MSGVLAIINAMLPLVFGVFGLIIGSFLNVLILRRGKQSVSGRSACPSCGHILRWYDLIPVLSWFLLKGSCRDCGHPISIQYPLVEALTAVVFLVIALAPILLPFKILALPIAALLIAIAVYDFRTTIIPDPWVLVAGMLCITSALLGAVSADMPMLPALMAGPIAAIPLFTLWLVSGGRWMGLGDSKLTLATGWLLGIQGGLTALFLAFVIGAIISLLLMFFTSASFARFTRTLAGSPHDTLKEDSPSASGFTMKSEIPFGPYLVGACFLVWFAQMYGFDLTILSIVYGV